MSYIRYKEFGNRRYAYEVTAYWDPEKKKPRQKVRYIGIVDDNGEILKKDAKEKLTLDFGDGYLLYAFMKKAGISHLIETVCTRKASQLLALICYRLCYASAMRYAGHWYEGNVARFLFKGVNLSSQAISRLLKMLGDEKLKRAFFTRYITSLSHVTGGIIIDTTALPNQIHLPFNAWGYHDGDIEKQIRFLFVVDSASSLPLYFRYLPGNIVDVSSLCVTVEELARLGIPRSFVLIDAGFFSEENIRELYEKRIDFLTRLPSSRRIYKRLIKEGARTMESFENAVRYGKRALFITHKAIDLYGKEAYAYIILDPERKGRETKRLLLDAIEGEDNEDIEYRLMRQGIMILVSSFAMEKADIVPLYYLRQRVEQLFGFSKDDLQLLPLRVHTEETLRGYLFLMFLTLTVFMRLRQATGAKYTVEEMLLIMRNLKCKIYENDLIVHEMTKQQKGIVEKLDIIVPKKMGI